MIWQCDSLSIENGFATAKEGEHRLVVTDSETGIHAAVQISVRSL